MHISKETEYALRTILYLTRREENNPISTRTIAQEQKIPSPFLTKIISRLSASGIVRTLRGPHGGVILAKAATDISVLDVVEVIEGPIRLIDCLIDPGSCPLGDDCAFRFIFCETQAMIVERWQGTTFADLSQGIGKERFGWVLEKGSSTRMTWVVRPDGASTAQER